MAIPTHRRRSISSNITPTSPAALHIINLCFSKKSCPRWSLVPRFTCCQLKTPPCDCWYNASNDRYHLSSAHARKQSTVTSQRCSQISLQNILRLIPLEDIIIGRGQVESTTCRFRRCRQDQIDVQLVLVHDSNLKQASPIRYLHSRGELSGLAISIVRVTHFLSPVKHPPVCIQSF